jgi:DNA-binding protein HU-beta/integration host factor subunit alpha
MNETNSIPSTSTRRDISVIVSKTHKIPQQLAYKIIDTTFEALLANLIENGHVELRGFGVFKVVQRCARRGRNPKQPEKEVPIPPRKTIKFHASRLLRQDLVNATVAAPRPRKGSEEA